MANKPRVTTVVCTYRRPKLLARTLASLHAQTVREFEVRVFDNASGDETAAVVEWFRQQGLPVHYHCHEENLGATENFRFALGQGFLAEYVHMLNDDDYILPRFFETALAGFAAEPSAVISMTRDVHAASDGEVRKLTIAGWKTGRFRAGEGAACILGQGHPELTVVLFRRDWLQGTGGFDVENFGMGSDVALLALAAARHPIYVSPEIGGVFSITPGQHSANPLIVDTWAKLFENLQRSSFLDEEDFLNSLSAAASTHVRVSRLFWQPISAGLAREWAGLRAFVDLCRRRPRHVSRAAIGFGQVVAAGVLKRLGGKTEASEDSELYRRAKVEVQRCAAMLESTYVDPCLESVG